MEYFDFIINLGCGSPPVPSEGFVTGGLKTLYISNEIVNYQCNQGLVLVGPANNTCQGDGTWSTNGTFCRDNGNSSAVTIAGAAGAMHLGPSTRGPHIATFYCKIFSLKAQVKLLLLNVTLYQ